MQGTDIQNLQVPAVTPPSAAPPAPPPDARGPMDRVRGFFTSIGNNIDLVTLYARQKDYYKLLEMVAPFISGISLRSFIKFTHAAKLDEHERGIKERLMNGSDSEFRQAYREKMQLEAAVEKATVNTAKGLDAAHTGFQVGLSAFSAWWEKSSTVRVYQKVVQQELQLDRPIKFSDLKKSANPIIRNAADYYSLKSLVRYIPDAFGLIRFVPAVTQYVPFIHKFIKPLHLEKIDGVAALLGAKSAYFTWYFIKRQTGSHYELARIWNKTEGIKYPPNRAVNQNINPGELVTQDDIIALYRNVAKEQNLPDFTLDDPLTSRVFEQVARYLNHNYTPELYQVKRPAEQTPDLKDTTFTHARLVELFGTGGIDKDDAMATAIRLEVLTRKGYAAYHAISFRLQHIKRPDEKRFKTTDDAAAALSDYLSTLDREAKIVLGEAWPPKYVEEEIRPRVLQAYLGKGFKPLAPEKAVEQNIAHPVSAPEMQATARRFSDSVTPMATDGGYRELTHASPGTAILR